MIATTLDEQITSWNRAAEQLFGYTQKEAMGKSITIIVPKSKRQEVARLLKLLKKGHTTTNYQTIRQHKTGRLIPLSLNASIIRDKTGRSIGTLRAYRDIAEQQKIEALKSEFLSIVAHELKTPLTAAKLYADLALMKSEEGYGAQPLTLELQSITH